MTLPELLALCAKATPGPWRIGFTAPYYHFQVCAPNGGRICGTFDALEIDPGPDKRQANAEHIAACSPEVVAALVRVAMETREDHAPQFGHAACETCSAMAALDAALASPQGSEPK